jgi:hypothetical protein
MVGERHEQALGHVQFSHACEIQLTLNESTCSAEEAGANLRLFSHNMCVYTLLVK